MKKNRKRLSEATKIKSFKASLKHLYDIGDCNLDSVDISVTIKEFLNDQRRGRKKQLCWLVRNKVPNITPKVSHKNQTVTEIETIDIESDEEFELVERTTDSDDRKHDPSILLNKITRAPIMTSALDRTRVTNGQFNLLVGAMGNIIKAKPGKTFFSVSTNRRRRIENRMPINKFIKRNCITKFPLKRVIVHWDGKLLKDTTNGNTKFRKRKVDRIAVVVTGSGEHQHLGCQKVSSGTGRKMAEVTSDELIKWNLSDYVIGMCCDTTSSNTGWKNGACAILEKECLKKQLILLPCRHHIFEVVLSCVFELIFGETSGPNVEQFKQFKEKWNDVDGNCELQGIPQSYFNTPLRQQFRTETIECLQNILSDNCSYLPRGDYRELIDLTLIVLGVQRPGYKLQVLGGLHNARWMCTILYAMKYYLVRKEMKLGDAFNECLEDFILFCCFVYVKQWLICPSLRDAAFNDLQFCKNLHSYHPINKKVAECAMTKFKGHLWYLGPELSVFALFSDKVSGSEKRSMIHKMKKPDGYWRRTLIPKYGDSHERKIDDLVTSRSLFAMEQVHQSAFKFMLHNDPTIWPTNADFKEAKHFVSTCNVVNDVAERYVSRMTTYNTILTQNEGEKQKILQVAGTF